ncbi:MAG: hypothetical protein ACI4QH_01965, partial [Candidatus Fimimonas sp.]
AWHCVCQAFKSFQHILKIFANFFLCNFRSGFFKKTQKQNGLSQCCGNPISSFVMYEGELDVACVCRQTVLLAKRQRSFRRQKPRGHFSATLVACANFGAKLFAAADGKSAVAEQQCHNQNQATRIDVEMEVFHLAATAAQKQDNQQNPSAVATAKAAAFFATATAVAVVKHSVEHFLPPFRRNSAQF